MRNHEIHCKSYTNNNCLGSNRRACLYPVMFRVKFCCFLAAKFPAVAVGIAGRIRCLAVPLGTAAASVYFVPSCAAIFGRFLFTAVGMLCWIRSGICFKNESILKRLAAEIGLGLGIGLLVSGALPAVDLVWALGVWLFFLIQALYFVLFDYRREREIKIEVDPFEKAKMAAETILSNWVF